MANFKTHLGVAAIGSGLLATLCLGGNIATPREVILLSAVGTVGGILPDIDLDHASPTKIMFTALGIVFAFLVMFSKADSYSIIELWLIWGLSYAVIRYLAWQAFSELTVHRGIFHSVAAALFFWFFTTALSYYLFDLSQLTSWLVGFFIFFGYLVHLSLDEIYSVDFMNQRIKSSFGTAIKLVDYRNAKSSGLMLGAVILAFLMTPSIDPFLQLVFSGQTYFNIISNLFPSGMWFEF